MNKVDQQSYIIHQFHLSESGRIAVEGAGWEARKSNNEVNHYLKQKDGGFSPVAWQFYHAAKKVVANGLEGVFEAGNGYGPFADQVVNLGPSYSCSVGDIVQCGGLFWIVKPYGFEEIAPGKIRLGRKWAEIQASRVAA